MITGDKLPNPVRAVQVKADDYKKEGTTVYWATQSIMDTEPGDEVPAPTILYESAQAAVNSLMRDYEIPDKAPLAWIVDGEMSIQAEYVNLTLKVFGMMVAAPEMKPLTDLEQALQNKKDLLAAGYAYPDGTVTRCPWPGCKIEAVMGWSSCNNHFENMHPTKG